MTTADITLLVYVHAIIIFRKSD